MGKAKVTSKAKQGIQSPLRTGRLVFSHLQESRAPSHIMVPWEDKRLHSECPSFFLLSSGLCCWTWHHMVWNISLVNCASCPTCVPSQLLVHPQPSHCWGSARNWWPWCCV